MPPESRRELVALLGEPSAESLSDSVASVLAESRAQLLDPANFRRVNQSEFDAAMNTFGAVAERSFHSAEVGDGTYYCKPSGQLAGYIVSRESKDGTVFGYFVAS